MNNRKTFTIFSQDEVFTFTKPLFEHDNNELFVIF
jgi:hypothetical protein